MTDPDLKAIVSAPPAACLQAIGKMNMGQDYAQGPLHDALVKMNAGRDLGPAGSDWLEWCQARMTAR